MANTSDDAWEESLKATDFECAGSEDPICYGEDVIAVTVVVAAGNPQAPSWKYAVTPEMDDLMYEPRFFLVPIWADTDEDVGKDTAHIKANKVGNELFCCRYCGSSILEGEVFLLLLFGQIQISACSPSGVTDGGATFVSCDQNPTHMCLSCQNVMHEVRLGLWDSRVKQNSECDNGTAFRCWRHGCSADRASCAIALGRVPTPWAGQ